MKKYTHLFFLLCLFCTAQLFSQNENKKWYFPYYAALDFMGGGAPTPLNNSAMTQNNYGCSSIADANGNLLFYTNGATVWDASHTVMANGTGLFGFGTQSSLIVKQPGSSTIYYIFNIRSLNNNNNPGFYYSIVDMSLAAGMGSVTVKNAVIYSGNVMSKLHGTKHANGMDYWIMIHERGSYNFRAYQFGSGGVNLTPVISAVGTYTNNWNNNNYYYDGQMKFSANGQKLGTAWYDNYYVNSQSPIDTVGEVFDFNKATGIVTNAIPLSLPSYSNGNYYYNYGGWGAEFSPDGSKFYVSRLNNYYNNNQQNILIGQWDMNAGSNQAVQSSSLAVYSYTYINNNNYYHHFYDMQLAPDDKIYCVSYFNNVGWQNNTHLSVINDPNNTAPLCNFTPTSQLISASPLLNAPNNFTASYTYVSLPNQIPQPCLTFTAGNNNITTCHGVSTASAAVLSVVGNTGTPSYTWTNGQSTHTTQAINNVPAGAWTVTVRDTIGCASYSVVTITEPPAITVTLTSSSPSICAGGGVLLTATASGGAGSSFTYSWSNGINFSVTIGSQALAGTHVYTAVATDINNCTGSNTISVLYQPNPPLTALPNQTICAGQSATLSTTGATGYTWQPGGANTNSIVVSPTVPVTVYT
ncbi:MAG: hypothetical protein KF900_10020, partial [Bacteroidetes bacterium]|nr:hypothetical protein [Bacteroidota bacterium]